jgi:hypothetical protein
MKNICYFRRHKNLARLIDIALGLTKAVSKLFYFNSYMELESLEDISMVI